MPPKRAAPVAKPAARAPAKPAAKPVKKPGVPASRSTTTTTKKPAAPVAKGKGKAPVKAQEAPAKPKWTKEDESARTIQKNYKRFRAQKLLQKKKKEKQDYEEQMDKLQKEAWVKMVQMEREQAEKERLKEEEKRREEREERQRRAKILEAAFDGDTDEIRGVLDEAMLKDQQKEGLSAPARELLISKHQKALSDCEDANGNTPLSEAAAGGHEETIRYLLTLGVDINSRGRYQRTPLWRAAFGGHLQACQCLLENGGDPRLHADDGTVPLQVAAIPPVEEVLQNWDISQTDNILLKIEADKERRQQEDREKRQAETNRLEDELASAEKENEVFQKELRKSYEEMNKRIFEHDRCVEEGKNDKLGITMQAIKDAEALHYNVKLKADKARERLELARLSLREQQKQEQKEKGDSSDLVGVKVTIRELDDVLFRDVGNKIASDGRWPLLIDTTTQGSTFLRYRDTNYMNALNPASMTPDVIRLALLGAIRYGKPAVVDMMEVDMFDTVAMKFDEVQEGLLDKIMTKEILKNDNFMSLVRPGDGEEYSKTAFLGARIHQFLFVLITQLWNPPDKLVEKTYPIRVIVPSLPDDF